MQTQVNDEKREVIPMYKLIDGVAESSFGTRESMRPVLLSEGPEGGAQFPCRDLGRCCSSRRGSRFDRHQGRIYIKGILCGLAGKAGEEEEIEIVIDRSSRCVLRSQR